MVAQMSPLPALSSVQYLFTPVLSLCVVTVTSVCLTCPTDVSSRRYTVLLRGFLRVRC